MIVSGQTGDLVDRVDLDLGGSVGRDQPGGVRRPVVAVHPQGGGGELRRPVPAGA